MKTQYKNPWFDQSKKNRQPYAGWTQEDRYHTAVFESDSEPIPAANGCLIYSRMEYGYPIFDVVLNGVCVSQRAGLNGAKQAAETKEWEQSDLFKGAA